MLINNIKAVIFDIDGTLADSLDVWAEADRIFLARRGYEYDSSVSAAMKTMHFMSAAEYLRQLYHIPDSLESVASEITDIVREKYFFEVSYALRKGAYRSFEKTGHKNVCRNVKFTGTC